MVKRVVSEETRERMRISALARGPRSLETRRKMSEAKFKGDQAGYNALHAWVTAKLGRPRKCSDCGFESNNSRQFHWANISGEYKRDLDDWVRLCVSCHFKRDDIHKKAWKTRKSNKENNSSPTVRRIRFNEK